MSPLKAGLNMRPWRSFCFEEAPVSFPGACTAPAGQEASVYCDVFGVPTKKSGFTVNVGVFQDMTVLLSGRQVPDSSPSAVPRVGTLSVRSLSRAASSQLPPNAPLCISHKSLG